VAWPNVFRRIQPRKVQDELARRSIRPAGAGWLRPRLEHVPIENSLSVQSAARVGDQVRLSLSNGIEREFDHVLLGTGYRVDISKYEFLDSSLLRAVRTVNGYPVLGRGLESSVAGLHFLGAPAAWSFGPLMRFVAGTEFTGRALARAVARRRSSKGRLRLEAAAGLRAS
jgi:hypothetical protein